MQSITELPASLLPTSGSLHGRPSIAALSSSDTVDIEDEVPCPIVPPADTSINKSPINVSSSKYFCLFELNNLCNFFCDTL